MSLQRHHRDILVWLLQQSEALGVSREGRKHVQWLLYYLDHDCDEAATCRTFDIHPSTLRRWIKKFDPSNHTSIESKSKRPHTPRVSQIDAKTIEIIRQYRMRWPHVNREMLSDLLWEKHGIALSSSTVGRVIKQYKLFYADSWSHKAKRNLQEDDVSFDDDYPDLALS